MCELTGGGRERGGEREAEREEWRAGSGRAVGAAADIPSSVRPHELVAQGLIN